MSIWPSLKELIFKIRLVGGEAGGGFGCGGAGAEEGDSEESEETFKEGVDSEDTAKNNLRSP